MLALADAVEQAFEELAILAAIDAGNSLAAMRPDVQTAIHQLRSSTRVVRWHGGRTIPATPGNLHPTSTMPYGVVAKILALQPPGAVRDYARRPAAAGLQRGVVKPA